MKVVHVPEVVVTKQVVEQNEEFHIVVSREEACVLSAFLANMSYNRLPNRHCAFFRSLFAALPETPDRMLYTSEGFGELVRFGQVTKTDNEIVLISVVKS